MSSTSEIVSANAQKAKDYTTVGVIVSLVSAAAAWAPSRSFVLSLHSSSLLGALSVYAGLLALVYVCYTSLMSGVEWRGGGVSGILNSDMKDGFHKSAVKQHVDTYYDNFGKESRLEKHDNRGEKATGNAWKRGANAQREACKQVELASHLSFCCSALLFSVAFISPR